MYPFNVLVHWSLQHHIKQYGAGSLAICRVWWTLGWLSNLQVEWPDLLPLLTCSRSVWKWVCPGSQQHWYQATLSVPDHSSRLNISGPLLWAITCMYSINSETGDWHFEGGGGSAVRISVYVASAASEQHGVVPSFGTERPPAVMSPSAVTRPLVDARTISCLPVPTQSLLLYSITNKSLDTLKHWTVETFSCNFCTRHNATWSNHCDCKAQSWNELKTRM